MSSEKPSSFVRVEELMPQITLEQAAAFYGVQLPDLKRIGTESRTACFLNCGKTKETGDRALAIQTDDPLKKWHCHQYGCGKGGTLIALCDLMKTGSNAAGGRVRGERFKEIRDDLQAILSGKPAASPLLPPQKLPPGAVVMVTCHCPEPPAEPRSEMRCEALGCARCLAKRVGGGGLGA